VRAATEPWRPKGCAGNGEAGEGELWNAVTGGHSASDRKDAFLTWCDNWATPQLGNHFPPSEALFAEVAESYHCVAQTPS
jgi:hypothetical protein